MRSTFVLSQPVVLCAILAGGIFALDLIAPIGVGGGFLYISIVLASLWISFPRAALLAAATCTGLIVLGFLLSPPGNGVHDSANRAIAIAMLWATAVLVTNREAALVEAEGRYRDLVRSVDAIVWRGDSKSFRFTFVSSQAETLLGYPVRRWIEEPTFWQDHMVPEDRERVLASCAEATRKGLRHHFDYRMVAADGRVVWLRDYVTVIMEDGEPKESIGVMVDITQQRTAEDELSERNKVLDMLYRVSGMVQAATSVEEACRMIAEEVSRASDFEIVAIELYDPDRHRLSFKGTAGIPVALSKILSDVPAEQSLSGIVARTGQPLVEMRASQRPEYGHPELRRLGVETFLCVPLLSSGNTIGVLSLASAHHKPVAPPLVQWISGLAMQIATLIARITAQLRLRDSEEKFQQLVSNVNEAFWIVDAVTHRIEYISPAFEHIWGTRPESADSAYRTMLESLHPDDAPHVRAAMAEHLHGRGSTIEYRIVRPDGLTRWIRCQTVILRDSAGSMERLIGVASDMTEQKQAEDALKRSEERLRRIFSVLAEAVIVQDITGRIIACNASAERILGLSTEELIGQSSDDPRWRAIHEDGSPFPSAQYPAKQTLRTGEPCTHVIMGLERPDGRLVWISVNTKPLFRGDDASPYGVVSSFQDITKRKAAEAALQHLLEVLEQRVADRTAELQNANAALREEMAQRREVEAALRRSESDLAEAQRIAHVGSWRFDIAENRATWSDEICRIAEVDRAHFDYSYESFLDLVHPEDRPLVHRAYTESLKNRTPYEIVHRLLMKDGRVKFVHERGETTYDEHNQPLCTIGTAQDITDRKVAEDKLHRSEERYRLLYEDNPSMYFTVDPEGIVLSVNRFGAEQLGHVPDELVGRSVLLVIHQDDRERVGEHLGNCARSPGHVWNWEFRMIRKDGSVRWVREAARAGLNPDGRPVLLIVCEDISARKRAEDALKAAQAELEVRVRLRTEELSEANSRLEAEIREHTQAKDTLQRRDAILQAVSFAAKQFLLTGVGSSHLMNVLRRLGEAAAVDHACVFQNSQSADGDVRMSLLAEWVNQGIPSMLGDPRLQQVSYREQGLARWAQELARGIPVFGFVADLPEAERAMVGIRGQRSIAAIPIFVGQDWWGMMMLGLIRVDRSWHPTEIEVLQVAVSTLGAGIQRQWMEDLIRLHTDELERLVAQRTERIKELESQRAQAEKLAALGQLAAGVAHEINNPIAGIKNAFLILKDAIPGDHAYYQFVGMIEREIDRVANIVRRMYDLYRNDSLQEQTVSLDILLQDLFDLLKPKLTQHGVTLRRHTAGLIPPLRLMRRDAFQVLLNIVQNAVEASPESGTVVIEATSDQNYVRITISDQGYGISSDDLPHIFEPFFSGQSKRKPGGMGLGLSVSYSLVHAMGGRIDVASRPNEGTTFTVMLPLARTPQMTGHSEGEPQCPMNTPASSSPMTKRRFD